MISKRVGTTLLSITTIAIALFSNGCFGRSEPLKVRPGDGRPVVKKQGVGGIRLEEVAAQRGITYRWPQQPRPMKNIDAFGCGCAFLDYDNDGWLDILLVASPCPRLYHNRGDGTFEDVTTPSGLDKAEGRWFGVGVGDFDGDGRLDIVLTGYHRLALLKNLDGKRFEDVTQHAGLDPRNHGHWGSSAAFMDLDGSGRLALIILNYVIFGPKERQYCELSPGVRTGCPPDTYRPEYSELWKNLGDGRFSDFTSQSGLRKAHGKDLVIAFADIDDDGRIDFYIGNDGTPSDFMHNLGGLKFKNVSMENGTAYAATGHAMAAMGADWADYDRDGRLDLAVSGFSGEAYALLRNMGQGTFEHVEDTTGITGATLNPLGFGTKWIDVDNDSWPDIMFANGHVYDAVEQVNPGLTLREPLMLFHNEPDTYAGHGRQFLDLIPDLGGEISRSILGRGLAVGDFDNDGRMDVLVVDFEGAPLLLHNVSQCPNHWVTLDLRSPGRNRFAYGAKVTARAGSGVWVAQVAPASSYLSSSDPRIHFGLGSVTKLDTITVHWPDGTTQVLHDVAADHILQITKGKTAPVVFH